MRTIIGRGLCLLLLMVLAAACSEDEPLTQHTPTRVPGPTATLTPAPPPSQTIVATEPPAPPPSQMVVATEPPAPPPSQMVVATETPAPDPLDRFIPPDPVEGVGDVGEALIAGHRFQLEVARTPSERSYGLMGRTSLPEGAVMLFVFGAEEYRGFWMKNTLIPLDILFLDARGVVVDVQTMYPQIGASDDALKRYRSAQPARYALEMNAGLAEALGIVPGTQVLFGYG